MTEDLETKIDTAETFEKALLTQDRLDAARLLDDIEVDTPLQRIETLVKPESQMELADYALVFDTMSRLVGLETEEAVVRSIFDLFDMICMPDLSVYLPIRNGEIGDILKSRVTSSVPADTIERMADLHESTAWSDSGDGFLVRLHRDQETLGILFVDEIAIPDYIENYLSFTLTLLPAMAMAVSNARTLKQLVDSKEALSEQQERLSTTLRSIGDAVISTDIGGHIVEMNPVAEDLTGWVISDAIGRPISEILNIVNTLTDQPAFLPVSSALSTGEVQRMAEHTTLISRDGNRRQISDSAAPIRNRLGDITGAVMVFSNVTEQYSVREALQAEKDNLAAIFASSPVGMLLLDEDLIIKNANAVASSLVSRDRKEIVGQCGGGGLGCFHSFEHESGCGFALCCKECALRQGLTKVVKDGTPIHGAEIHTSLVIGGQEHHPWLRVSAVPVLVNNRKHVVVAMDDITDRKQAEDSLREANASIEDMNRQLREALAELHKRAEALEAAKEVIEEHAVEMSHQATHDPLTSLPNRKDFEQRLSDLITSSTDKSSASFVVLFLDLDKFKMINDTLGHKVGDLLLIKVAERMQSCLRSEDILARMGGDEFTVVLPSTQARTVVESVASRVIDSISRTFNIQEHKFVIGASIGMASYPSDGTDTVTLLKHADAAMYKAKQAGRGRFCWYSGEVDVENQQRADMEMDIRSALEQGQFNVHYQPIVDIGNGSILGAEALLRWEHPEKGMISPSLFIPIAEEIGLIGRIGDYVLHTACAQTAAWRDEGIHLSQICVNVSTRQIRDDTWLDSVRAVLSETGLEPRCLNLEVTQNDIAADYESMRTTLRSVHELGICMSIDDFGMGKSSLSRLKDFPATFLSVDGSFIRDIANNRSDNTLVRSIIDLAHNQGMKVIAEWVETESQMEILRSIGCDFAQGYYISPALSSLAFGEFIRKHKTDIV